MTNCYMMYKDFKYWFKFNPRTSEFEFYDKEDPEFKYTVSTANSDEYHDMFDEFEEFKRRPEYAVYRFMISSRSISYKDELDPKKLDLYISDYEDILAGVCYIRTKKPFCHSISHIFIVTGKSNCTFKWRHNMCIRISVNPSFCSRFVLQFQSRRHNRFFNHVGRATDTNKRFGL